MKTSFHLQFLKGLFMLVFLLGITQASGQVKTCAADFTFSIDPSNTNRVIFSDRSTGDVTHWKWDFDDYSTSTLQNPVHVYTGYYYSADVTLYVWNNDSTSYSSLTVTIFLPDEPGACAAAFSYRQDYDNVIYFTDRSVGDVQSWLWTFEAGDTSTFQNPSYTFPDQGTFSINMTIRNADSSCYQSKNHYVLATLDPFHCEANFTHHPVESNLMLISFFNITIGNMTWCNWDFGDGTGSHEFFPDHLYSAPGAYYVTLSVLGATSLCNSTKSDSVMVYDGDCAPDFNYWYNPSNPKTVTFNNQSMGNSDTNLWDFGDGSTSTEPEPVHVYQQLGAYTVSLSLSGTNCQETISKMVFVFDSAAFYLQGKAFAGSVPMTGKVYAFSSDTSQSSSPVKGEATPDPHGNYLIQVPDGPYYLWAIPDTPDYLPTYYSGVSSWEEATIVSPGKPGDPWNINLLACSGPQTGGGTINGHIVEGKIPASLLSMIRMILKDGSGSEVGFTSVDQEGNFSFGSLAFGSYLLDSELPGCLSEPVTLLLSAANPVAEIRMTYSNGRILGFAEEKEGHRAMSVFPNPAGDNVTVRVWVPAADHATIKITDLTGRTVYDANIFLVKGENKMTLDLPALEKGSYILILKTKDGIILHDVLVRK